MAALFTMETLSVMLSGLGLAIFIVTCLLKGANMKAILICNSLGNLLIASSYLCTLNFNGAISSVIGMTVAIINYFFAVKEKKIPLWLLGIYALAFVWGNLITFTGWVDLVAIAAGLAAVLMISARTGKGYRLWSIANDGLWSLFDILRGSYGPLLTHGVLVAVAIVGFLLHDRKPNQKTEA